MKHRRVLDALNLRKYISLLEQQDSILRSIIDSTASPAMLDLAKADLENLQAMLERDRARASNLEGAI